MRFKLINNPKMLQAATKLIAIIFITILFMWIFDIVDKRQQVELANCKSGNDGLFSLIDMKIRPWDKTDDPDCQHLAIQFIRHKSQRQIRLSSYPGSGNTWTRGLIERLSGYFTGSVYADKTLFMQGYYGEMMQPDCGCTLLQKTHDTFLPKQLLQFNGSRVVVIRNPYDSLKSFRQFSVTNNNHVKLASENDFVGKEWDFYVKKQIGIWNTSMYNWITNINAGLVMHYENLIRDREGQLRKLMRYLNYPVDEQRLQCTLKHDYATFKRKNKKFQRDPYTPAQKILIEAAIANIQQLLLQKNHELMPIEIQLNE